jgi:hypothetical protein
MADGTGDQARRVLLALADLAPSAEQRSAALMVPTEWFRWLGAGSVALLAEGPYSERPSADDTSTARYAPVDRRFAEQLASVDQLRPEQRSLRVGWLFVAGRTTGEDGRARRVLHPLVTVPVRVHLGSGLLGGARLLPAGDVEISPLVDVGPVREELERSIEIGGGALDGVRDTRIDPALLARLVNLRTFALAAAGEAGLPASAVVPAEAGPEQLARGDGLVVVAGVAVYATHDTGTAGRAGSLRAWASGRLDRWTAFHSIYVDAPAPTTAGPAGHADDVVSPFVLTPVQREAVVRSRTEPITVVSGAPGTGKSHTIVAIACDALARGESVLVAAKADATVDALLALLDRAPGPNPVVFGSSGRREALAARLAAGQLQPLRTTEVAAALDEQRAARERALAARARIVDLLRAEQLVARPGADDDRLRTLAPGLFDPATDLEAVAELLAAATAPAHGWWSRRRRRKHQRAVLALAGAPGDGLADLHVALAVARAARVAGRLVADGGLALGPAWAELAELDDALREATARWLAADSRSEHRLNRSTLPAVTALATALRSGRAARRDQLARLGRELTQALPLWVGSLPDIDDLLPPVPGFFDLVILDEASSIDQPLAVPALLRAGRGVVVGDPRQLRHVSFLADERTRSVVEAHGLAAHPLVAARLDVRRNSAFDLATGVAPVLVLDEHFRSHPHLVDLVARRLYGGAVHVATRAPSTTSVDCIHLVRVDGRRDRDGVVAAEVAAIVDELRRLRAAGEDSVGVVTPFRAQADAIEAAVLEALGIDDLQALDLRVGTVHAFQGNERDVVLASLGVGPDDTGSWRFVEDPHLFAVFATRARQRMVLFASAEPPRGGLVADYLAQADHAPGPPPGSPPGDPWVATVAADLAGAGVPVITGYPTGRHVLDVCAARDGVDVAVECGVHADGPLAHVERHLALRRARWELLEAYPSRWAARRGELVVELLDRLGRTG